MKRIVEIVPARPGWYSRWRLATESTRCYQVSLWALLEEADGTGREVIGVDCAGQWPGADDDPTGAEFIRYLFKTPDSGPPEDAEPPGPRSAGFPVPAS
ncbi:hypothetical protein C1I95_15780 [Micromonospora craterilacus]|uniref:Uncharacterized protein n=1 Tax=Micromonospora craterilacus TaxID=1655439 RepID=A0A2W2E4X2_9ACTN|nr:hypothetical protein [Micromonospora craterilacus]PZG17351.1 hypothetical protein C1I95_15780 [Micromonospora craterilacus]